MMQVAPPSTKYDKVIGLKRSSKLHTKARNTQNITKLLHSLCQIAPELVQATWSSLQLLLQHDQSAPEVTGFPHEPPFQLADLMFEFWKGKGCGCETPQMLGPL